VPVPAALMLVATLAMPFLATAARSEPAAPVILHYLNAPAGGQPLMRPPTLYLTVAGARHRAVLDTGSTGVVVAARSLDAFDALEDIGPGEITYTSSGRVMRGRYVLAPVTVEGAGGARITTRPLPVLAVTHIECLAHARSCTPDDAPRRVAMIGIGFGRERDRQPNATPGRNPFLNLPAMAQPAGASDLANIKAGGLGRGYVLTRASAQVGLAPGDEAGFEMVKLSSSEVPGDWSSMPVCLSLAGRRPPACGAMLMDTGVARMFISVPGAQSAGLLVHNGRGSPVLADGTRIALLPAPGAAAPDVSFTIGDDADPMAPSEALVVYRPGRPAFINTTVRFLNRYDYLFDADAGRVGLKAR